MYGGTTNLTVTIHLKAETRAEYEEAVEQLCDQIRSTLPKQRVVRDDYSPERGRIRKVVATVYGRIAVSHG